VTQDAQFHALVLQENQRIDYAIGPSHKSYQHVAIGDLTPLNARDGFRMADESAVNTSGIKNTEVLFLDLP